MRVRRGLMIAALLIGVVLLGAVVALWLTRPRHNITQEAFDAIEFGMNERKVETLVGVPAGDYRTGEVSFVKLTTRLDFACGPERVNRVPTTVREWHGDAGSLLVTFDQRGGVMESTFEAGQVRPFDLLLIVRRRLHFP